ncbi:MAG: CPBP family intramembrane metalloprotease [Clostridiales bacterium]|nr:CPBP family intramembrane metalloprotease [Clostridiales bacterium]
MQYDSPGKKIWRYLSPILVYYGIVMLVSFISSFFITYQLMGSLTASADMKSFTEELMMRSLEASVPIYLISGLISLPFLWRMMRKDRTFRKFVGDRSALKWWTLLYCALAGILCCLAGSILITISQAGLIFNGYEETSQNIFSQSALMQLAAVGLVMPFVEEIIFRGLIYSRMKDYMSANMAMLLSSLIFGIYHGNIIQAVYGFVMGILMVFVYEKYQTLAAPVICHMGANLTTLVFSFFNVTFGSVGILAVVALICLAALYLILRLIQKQVNVRIVPNEKYIDISIDGKKNNPNGANSGIYPPPQGFGGNAGKDSQTRQYTVDDYYPKPKEHEENKEE